MIDKQNGLPSAPTEKQPQPEGHSIISISDLLEEKKKQYANIPPLKTMDAETLQCAPLPKTLFLIKELLPQGLHLLAGSPKIGKSWLILSIGMKIAKGEHVWGFETYQSDVLYLCLEDKFKRIQERLLFMKDIAPPNMHLSESACCIECGLIEQLELFVLEHPNTKLIAIDTLQKVRSSTSDINAYAHDYKTLAVIKEFADKYSLCIILVHHLRKQSDKDPLYQVSGTTAMTGAVDGNYVLVKDKRSEKEAIFYVTGRDVLYQEIKLRFEDDSAWSFVSREQSVTWQENDVPCLIQYVIDFIKANGSWSGTATELLEQIPASEVCVNSITKELNKYREELILQGICFNFKRTATSRTIYLEEAQ